MRPAAWEAKLTYRLDATFRGGIAAASSLRTMGATRVPRISMARSIFSCGSVETPIWKVMREMPPRTSLSYRIFSATVSASPMSSAPVGPRTASNCARVVGGQPRSLPISVNVCAYPDRSRRQLAGSSRPESRWSGVPRLASRQGARRGGQPRGRRQREGGIVSVHHR
jgi:hypothetical protein